MPELVLRLLQYAPFQYHPYSVVAEPTPCLVADSIYGFALSNGKHQVRINDSLIYNCTHTLDSARITSLSPTINKELTTVHIHGCSFTFGMGVNDEDSYPFLLQSLLDTIVTISNQAVPGHGTIQSLLKLREQEKQGTLPNLVVLNYASFHDERNVLSSTYRQSLALGFANNENKKEAYKACKFPYVELNEDKKDFQVNYCAWADLYQNWILRTYSSTVNFLQTSLERNAYPEEDNQLATKLIIKEIQEICLRNETQFLLVGILTNDKTTEMVSYFQKLGIQTLMMDIDLTDEHYNNMPYDSHPNRLAHKLFAQKVFPKVMQVLKIE
ncbi:MAG: hypothetical protein GY810_20885 [Aureispira sp.]|nr:hypothetical protein [Aureispira sp.]